MFVPYSLYSGNALLFTEVWPLQTLLANEATHRGSDFIEIECVTWLGVFRGFELTRWVLWREALGIGGLGFMLNPKKV